MVSLLPQIGAYRVLEELGKGAMGTVYRAEGEDGDVAIKVMHPQLVQDSEDHLARFRREADVGLQVQHENVVRTYAMDSFQRGAARHHYLVLEYVEGQDLRGLLSEIERRAGETPDGDTQVFLAERFLEGARGEEATRHLDAALAHLTGKYELDRVGALADRALDTPGLLEGEPRYRVLMKAFTAHETAGHKDARRAVLEEAAAIARDLDDASLLANVTISQAKHTASRGTLESTLELARVAEGHARRAGDAKLLARSLGAAGTALRQMGRLDDAIAEYEAMRDALAQASDPALEAYAVIELGRCRLLKGEGASARAEIEQAIELFREMGERHSETVAWSILGNASWIAGDYEESMRCNEPAIAILKTTGYRKNLGLALGNIALVHTAQGHLGAAKDALEGQLDLSRECGNTRGVGIALLNLGSVWKSLGKPEEAREVSKRAIEVLREIEARLPLGHATRMLATIEHQEERTEEAQRWAEETAAIRRELPDRAALAETLLLLAALQTDRGDQQGAAAHVDEALQIGRELNNPGLLLQCHIEEALRLGRDPGPALAIWAEHPVESAATTDVELRYAMWKLSGDASHLEAAREKLAYLREHAPPEYRETRIENVPLHRCVTRGE